MSGGPLFFAALWLLWALVPLYLLWMVLWLGLPRIKRWLGRGTDAAVRYSSLRQLRRLRPSRNGRRRNTPRRSAAIRG